MPLRDVPSLLVFFPSMSAMSLGQNWESENLDASAPGSLIYTLVKKNEPRECLFKGLQRKAHVLVEK